MPPLRLISAEAHGIYSPRGAGERWRPRGAPARWGGRTERGLRGLSAEGWGAEAASEPRAWRGALGDGGSCVDGPCPIGAPRPRPAPRHHGGGRGSRRAAQGLRSSRWCRGGAVPAAAAGPGAPQCPLWRSTSAGPPRWSLRGWLWCCITPPRPPIMTPGARSDRDGTARRCRDGVTESSPEPHRSGPPCPARPGRCCPHRGDRGAPGTERPKPPGGCGAPRGIGTPNARTRRCRTGWPRAAGSSAAAPGAGRGGGGRTRRCPVPPVLGSARGGRERAARPHPSSQERGASPRGGARERGGRRRNRTANFPGAAGAGPWAAARAEHNDRRPRPPALPRAAAAAAARRALPRRRRRRWVRPDGQRGRGGRRRDSARSCAGSAGIRCAVVRRADGLG